MKKFLQALILSNFILLLSANHARAGHNFMGGSIGYKSLGNDQYSVTLKLYKDCGGSGGFHFTMTAKVIPLNCNASPFNIVLDVITITDITPVCTTTLSKCQGGTYQYGMEEGIYRCVLDLSAYTNCCDFSIVYDTCCRNGAISTGPANEGFYFYANINKCISNSSPVWTSHPPLLMCVGQNFCYNIGAIDATDGDSLSYSLDSAMKSASQRVTYGSGYGFNKPVMFLGSPNANAALPAGFHLDSINGDLCFRPTKVEMAVIVIRVTEWRKINGVVTKVGDVRLDFQVMITTCPNNKIPQIAALPAYNACAGRQLCFDIIPTDLDSGDTVRVSWNKAIPGATFTEHFPSGSKKQNATFCWTPTDEDTLGNPHIFSVTAKDNACPINAQFSRAFHINVMPVSNATATRQFTKYGCNQVSFDATPSRTGSFNYNWVIKRNSITISTVNQKSFSMTFPQPGKYTIKLTFGDSLHCPVEYSDTLELDSLISVALPPDTALCRGEALQIVPVVSYAKGKVKFLWNTNDTIPDLNITINNTAKYYLTVSDSTCSSTDTILVSRIIPGNISAGNNVSMCYDGGTKILSGTPAGGTWSGTGVSGTVFDPLISGPGIFYLFYRFTDSTGCEGLDSAAYTVHFKPNVNAGKDTLVCSNSNLLLQGIPIGGSWSGPGVSGNIFTPSSSMSGKQTLIYTYYSPAGCMGADSIIADVKPAPVVSAGADTSVCENSNIFSLQGSPAGGTWFGTGVSGNSFNPQLANGQVFIYYRFTTNFGCQNTDSRLIKINKLPAVSAGNNRTVCREAAVITLGGSPSGGSWSGNSVSGNQFDPSVAGPGVHTLTYEYTDANSCSNADFTEINVPDPLALFTATPLSGASPLTVNFSDISSVIHTSSWNFGDPSSGSNGSNLKDPSHVFNQSGLFTVRLIITDVSGCRDTLTNQDYISVSPNTGMFSMPFNKGIQVYPNPASGSFDLMMNPDESKELTLTLYDIRGVNVKQMLYLKPGVRHVDCEDLQAGMYFLEVSGDDAKLYRTKIVLY